MPSLAQIGRERRLRHLLLRIVTRIISQFLNIYLAELYRATRHRQGLNRHRRLQATSDEESEAHNNSEEDDDEDADSENDNDDSSSEGSESDSINTASVNQSPFAAIRQPDSHRRNRTISSLHRRNTRNDLHLLALGQQGASAIRVSDTGPGIEAETIPAASSLNQIGFDELDGTTL